VDYREQNGPFRSISDLLGIKGIGQATLDGIADLITVSE
jgi:competence ComEA-like helix-hairpin-helix protein